MQIHPGKCWPGCTSPHKKVNSTACWSACHSCQSLCKGNFKPAEVRVVKVTLTGRLDDWLWQSGTYHNAWTEAPYKSYISCSFGKPPQSSSPPPPGLYKHRVKQRTRTLSSCGVNLSQHSAESDRFLLQRWNCTCARTGQEDGAEHSVLRNCH